PHCPASPKPISHLRNSVSFRRSSIVKRWYLGIFTANYVPWKKVQNVDCARQNLLGFADEIHWSGGFPPNLPEKAETFLSHWRSTDCIFSDMSLAALIRCSIVGAIALLSSFCVAAPASDRLEWRSQDNRVSAEIKSARVFSVLEEIAVATGWQIY